MFLYLSLGANVTSGFLLLLRIRITFSKFILLTLTIAVSGQFLGTHTYLFEMSTCPRNSQFLNYPISIPPPQCDSYLIHVSAINLSFSLFISVIDISRPLYFGGG